MTQKPSIPKGTRDFGPSEMACRNYIFDTVRSVFRRYGYSPIETPAMENLSTLLGKYGEEGDKLLFKILNSGDAFRDIRQADPAQLSEAGSNALALKVCEKGLRYDLTVPFARYVVQHRNELTFPFKRFQIQPVWRADRPQKGRYREFYQCDVDVVGSGSLLYELEMVQIADEVFRNMGIRVLIKINNRKILSGLAEISGQSDKLTDITVAIDKIDKIGLDAVKAELAERGVLPGSIARIEPVLTLSGNTDDKLAAMRRILEGSETGQRGLDETEELFRLIRAAGVTTAVEFDLSNLTGIFGLPDTSGVGISFGADRIYDVLTGLDKFPQDAVSGTEYLFANMGPDGLPYILTAAAACRAAGHSAEIYPESAKLRKQFEYADRKGIKYVVIAGEDEAQSNELTIKNIKTGEQKKVKLSEIF